jgi:peptidoglycan/xylan/chitin deacetylase (PgdA/CDA1 family)
MGGITIRVSRGDNPPWHDAAIAFSKGYYTAGYPEAMKVLEEHKVHASEYSSVGLDYDYRIDNNGTIDELHRQVDSIINL